MSGPPPKPTALKLISGNPGKRPPKVANEAQPPIARPSPPEHLSDEAKVEWGRVIDPLYDCGLMTHVDRPLLAAYCDAYSHWVEASRSLALIAAGDPRTKGALLRTKQGNWVQNPIVGTLRCARADMVRFALEFGMSPASRSRIDVGLGAGGDPQDPREERFFGR